MLENFPKRVLCAFRPLATQFDGEIFKDRIEIRVSIAAFEETYDVLPVEPYRWPSFWFLSSVPKAPWSAAA